MRNKFNLFSAPGNLGFYNSCEITQLFLHRKSDAKNIHLFILVCFEAKPFSGLNHKFLTNKPILINTEYSLCIQRYNVNLETISVNFKNLSEKNEWNYEGNANLVLPVFKKIPPQFVPAKDTNPLGQVLKNNFIGGSYIIEMFDESKVNFDFLLDLSYLNNYNKIFTEVKRLSGIDLQLMRDRVGNIIFQFPISIAKINSRSLPEWDGVNLEFAWDPNLANIPDCIIEVSSTYDSNYMGSASVDYNKSKEQIVYIGNLDGQKTIRIWLKESQLLIFLFDGTYLRGTTLNSQIVSQEPRLFKLNGVMQELPVHSSGFGAASAEEMVYTRVINSRLYKAEKDKLVQELAFMQFGQGNNQFEEAISKLRMIIKKFGHSGVYLWDPFLRPEDILQTLFHSETMDVPLKAIGAINDAVINVYNNKGKTVSDILLEYKDTFVNASGNNHGLNLEFRCQYEMNGWAFHDRFLMFPGSKNSPPRAFSLGTSVNSVGKSHHIIQEVSHPQRVIDAFNELWEQLDSTKCLVWKSK